MDINLKPENKQISLVEIKTKQQRNEQKEKRNRVKQIMNISKKKSFSNAVYKQKKLSNKEKKRRKCKTVL